MKSVGTLFSGAIATVIVLAGALSVQAGMGAVERVHDFGFVGIDYDLFHVYKLVNTGDKPIRIDSVRVNCDCSMVSCNDSIIAPRDTGRVHLKFNTRNYYGPTSKVVRVYWHGDQHAVMELFYKSVVGQWYYGLKPRPQSLFFLPKNHEKRIVIPNPQMTEVKLADIITEDTLFSVEAAQVQASKGKSLELLVRPLDNLPTGTYFGSFTIKLDMPLDLDPAYISIPVKIVRF